MKHKFKPAVVSNADLYDMIKFDQKEKIKFKHTSEMPYIIGEYEEEIDLAFIDETTVTTI